MPAMSWVHKLLFPLREPLAEQDAGGGEAQQRLEMGCIRYEMLLAVQACSDTHRHRAADKIRRAGSPMDLWQLRPEIYLYLAQDLGQCQANARINALSPLFKGWVPEAAGAGSKHNTADGHGLH
jgi:hypothetical protein